MSEPVVLAVDIGGTSIAGARVPTRTPERVLDLRTLPTPPQGPAVLAAVLDLLRVLRSEAEQRGCRVLAAGIGTAGAVDPVTGAIASSTDLIPGWTRTPLRARAHADLGLPVSVIGDVHAHALGEFTVGVAREVASCLVVAVGTGVGGAYVDATGVRTGPRGLGGHVGHVLHPAAVGLRCSCGRDGHVEAISSGTGIAQAYERLGGEAITGAQVDARARAGDALAREVMSSAGLALGEVVAGLANAWDPDAVVVSGSVAAAGEVWWDGLRAGFRNQAMTPLRGTPLMPGVLGPAAPLLGAARLAIEGER